MRWLLTIMLLVLPAIAEATTFYVNKSGSDANSCATAQSSTDANAKLTMVAGIACLSAGDTLIVGNGTYDESIDNLIPSGGGSWATATTIQSETARGATLRGTTWNFRIIGSRSYIIIKDMVIDADNTSVQTVVLNTGTGGYPHHIRLDGTEHKNSSVAGVYLGNDNGDSGGFHEIFNCWIHDNGTTLNNQGIYFLAHHVTLRGCLIEDSAGPGISLFTSGGGTAHDNLIEENIIRNNGTSGGNQNGIMMAVTRGHTIRRNVIYGHSGIGMTATQGAGDVDSTTIDHNTISGNGTGISLVNTGNSGNVVRNNLVVGNTSTQIGTCNGCTLTDNRTSGTLADLFVSHTTGDYTLKAGSAAINDGTDISLAYNGAAPDHGAFETFVIASAEVGLIDATSLILTFTNNVQPPLLPASGITGFTVTEDAAPITVSSCARTGDNIIDCTLGSSIVGGRTVLVSYSGGNVTDSSLVGNSLNQPLLSFTDQAVTNNVGGGSSAVLTQTYYRFHHLLGTESAPVVLPGTASAVNTPITINPGGKVRLRLKVACTAADCDPLGMFLRYSLNSGGYSNVVPDAFGADNIRFVGTATISGLPDDTTATTEQLTSDHASMVACALVRTSNAIPSIDLSQNSETECEYVVEVDSDASAGDTYDFRLYSQTGTALSAYTVTPRITVQKVASGGR